MKRLAVFLILGSILWGGAWAQGDAAAGDATGGDAAAGAGKILTCAACHGLDGNSVAPLYPSIGGQNYRYILSQLRAMKAHGQDPDALGNRSPGLMIGQLAGFDDQDLRDIAAHYAGQSPHVGEALEEKAIDGEAIYRGGVMEKKVAACTACHSPRGGGNPPAGFPRLSGQTVDYTIAQLRAYREGQRTTDEDYGGMMRQIAARLTDTEIEAVAQYLHGLH